MRFYSLMVGLGRPKSFVGKIMLVSFLGVHVPLIGLIAYLLLASSLPSREMLTVVGVVLSATLVGTGATMAALWALIAPVRAASRALNDYLTERRIPDLPTLRGDEAGQLMADVQEAVMRLDATLDAAFSARDQAIDGHHATFGALAHMGHELKTPLNAVLGFSEILQNERRGPQPEAGTAEFAGDIHANGARLLDLVQVMLELSRAESGIVPAAIEDMDLGRALTAAVGLTRPGAEARGVALQVEAAAGPAVVQADARSTRQVLLHLVAGLAESAPRGATLRLRLTETDEGWRVGAQATGGGFDPDDLPGALAAHIDGPVPSGRITSTSALGLRLMAVRSLAVAQGIGLSLHSGGLERSATLDVPRLHRAGDAAAPDAQHALPHWGRRPARVARAL